MKLEIITTVHQIVNYITDLVYLIYKFEQYFC